MSARRDSTAHRGQDVLRDQVRAWWVSVLAGQVDQPHPTYSGISAGIEGDTLVLGGQVPTAAARAELEHEAEHLLGRGVEAVRNELVVRPDEKGDEERGLLSQTFIAVYEAPAAAQFAAEYLQEHLRGQTAAVGVVTPGGDAEATLARLLPEEYRGDARALLNDGRSLVVVTVDETEAFGARELLEEETRSVQSISLPPQAGDAADEGDAAAPASSREPEGGAPRRR